jgi:hypothetical protein
MNQFEMSDLSTFLQKYSDVASTEVLTAIWSFGNKQYEIGYSDARNDSYNEDEWL